MSHDKNFNDKNNFHSEQRLKNIMNRIPDKKEFLSDLESYVDENYPEGEENKAKQKILFLVPLGILLLAFAKPTYRFYKEYKSNQPVSLEKLIELHTQNSVTHDILVRHMHAQPFGEAIKPIQAIADSGNMHAQNITCWVYFNGFNVDKDPDFGAEYCHKSAVQGHPGAQSNLGNYYYKYATQPDIEKAIYYYSQAAEKRWNAAVNLAEIYEKSQPPLRDFEKAVHYKKLAVELEYTPAMIALGNDYAEGRIGLEPDGEQAIKYLTMALNAGHIDAHGNLAIFYLYAQPPHQDYQKMIYHAKETIKFGHPATGFGVLGDAYLKGLGVEKDEKTAVFYFARAAEYGNKYAVNKLAFLKSSTNLRYSDAGYGFEYEGVMIPYVAKNFLNYPEHFSQLLDVIHNKSVDPISLSKIFEYLAANIVGDEKDGDIPVDYIGMFYPLSGYKAEFQPMVKAYETMASIGSGRHAYHLGLIYMSGSGVIRDPKTCIDWISKAMDMGYPDVDEYVGEYLGYGEDLYGDSGKTARKLLKKAASLGSQQAARRLGEIYQEGRGVEANKVAALYWMYHADKGRLDLGVQIKTLRDNMSSQEIELTESLFKNCNKSEFNSCFTKL